MENERVYSEAEKEEEYRSVLGAAVGTKIKIVSILEGTSFPSKGIEQEGMRRENLERTKLGRRLVEESRGVWRTVCVL